MTYGTVNVDSVVNSDGVTSGGLYGFKNRIINGAMMIDQRNAGASVTLPSTGSQYTLDRWTAASVSASKYSVQQNAGSVTPPAGFTNYLGVTSLAATSVASGDYYFLVQPIEGYNVADFGFGTANAKTVTLSFWVRSSLTGTFGGALQASGSARTYPFSYTIPSANTWTQISVTVAGDTTGTWLTNNGTGLQVFFGLGIGSTYSGTANVWSATNYISVTGATSVVGTNGATFYITGVQLEKGSTATSFDYRPYGTELSLCQRYYQKLTSSVQYTAFAQGVSTGSTTSSSYAKLTVTMRSAPTVAFNDLLISDSASYVLAATPGTMSTEAGTDAVRLDVGNTAGATTFRPASILSNTSSSFIAFSAEL